ncbi:tetratricopeptide repeat protein [Sorangium sp. So ce426]|uniref:tetratricopeptide repeat protein n=1 Tax=Sorangium sp. So ce426 TaxID=3133312 RepID=UPI003F5C649C
MNVKNEARIIERCLDSVLPIVDGWAISDTGSTDATVQFVTAAAERWGKPGKLVRHAWRNFGFNRTLSAREARAWVEERGWPRERTYLLFLDADMVLEASPQFDKQKLDATYYQVVQDTGALSYLNTRLACLSHDWQAVGATHEYWQAPGEGRGERLDTLFIHDLGDGGSKGDKLIRDYRLLKQEVARDPKNPRHVFYLAQTCFDGGRFAEAAELYARRWAMGGWEEERWYARYKQGLSLLRLGDSQRASGLLLEAFDVRPTRAEPLWALARHQRERSLNHAALLFAERALEIPFPSEDVLFIEKAVYEWQIWEEIMISAWYVRGRCELGFAACERLFLRRGHDDEFYNYVASNESFYHSPLPRLRSGAFDLDPAVLRAGGIDYKGTNPTVVKIDDRVLVNVRLVNYDQDRGQCYTPAGDDVFRTRNCTVEWDAPSGRAFAARESRGAPATWPTATNKLGLEDMRWTRHDGRVWFTATCYQAPDAVDQCRVVLGRMSEELDAVEHLVLLRRDVLRPQEKNWLPWSRDGELFVIYAYDPFEVRRVDAATGETVIAHSSTPSFRAAGFRGSAPPLPIPGRAGRWLLMTHEVAYRPQGNAYAHRFVEVDERDGIVAASRPFHFDHVGIEYAVGLCDLGDGKLLVTYGYEDREARWLELEWREALDSLRLSPG